MRLFKPKQVRIVQHGDFQTYYVEKVNGKEYISVRGTHMWELYQLSNNNTAYPVDSNLEQIGGDTIKWWPA